MNMKESQMNISSTFYDQKRPKINQFGSDVVYTLCLKTLCRRRNLQHYHKHTAKKQKLEQQ